MNEQTTLQEMYQEISDTNMENVCVEAEIHFGLALNKLTQLDLHHLDMDNRIVLLRIQEAKAHYRQALLAIDYEKE